MKIVNLETFRAMPANTLYSKYKPCVFEDLMIKGETIKYDFFTTNYLSSCIQWSERFGFFELLDRAPKTGESLKMEFETEGRDGLFEEGQLFAVWEKEDVLALIERLKRCV